MSSVGAVQKISYIHEASHWCDARWKDLADSKAPILKRIAIAVFSPLLLIVSLFLKLLSPCCKGEANRAFNPKRDRYENVLPSEATRVLCKDPRFYFNANWVLGGKGIASQGPLPSEHGPFWMMALEHDISTIVMLTNLAEGGRDKCSQYWPGENQTKRFSNGMEIEFGGEQIVFQDPINPEGPRIIKRAFNLCKGDQKRIVTQLHLENWPDFGVVDDAILTQIICLAAHHQEREGGPILAHCSAGLGRTGTFFAALAASVSRFGDGLSFEEIVKRLRDPQTGREGSIQTEEQYNLAKRVGTAEDEGSRSLSSSWVVV